jgi:hypothetical protein
MDVSGGVCSEYLATAEFVKRLITSSIVSVVERVLTQGRHCFAHLLITVPI